MTTAKDAVALITCGGTIDKIYFDALSEYSIGEPACAEILSRAHAAAVYPPPQSIIKKDSLEMSDDDRRRLCDAVASCTAARIVITHGTDTMCESAKAVAAAGSGKTVVFVGSFAPAIFRNSDADFNLGFALGAACALPAGVYIAMNGQIFPASNVQKNRTAGRFESLR